MSIQESMTGKKQQEAEELVSVIAPCYNGEKYLDRFLLSVMEQTYRPIELIFVDDGSTDNTVSIFKRYEPLLINNGIRTKYIYQQNAGQAAALNTGLKAFSGQYLMWMDSDDIMLPQNVKRKMDFLQQHPRFDFVLSEGTMVSETDIDKPIGKIGRVETAPHGRYDFFSDLINERNVIYGPGSILVRADALRRAIPSGTIYESRYGQNWQMMLPLTYHCDYGLLPEPLFKYVIHMDSHSHTRKTYDEEMVRIDAHEDIIKQTISGISSMSKTEQSKWIGVSEEHFLKKRFQTACLYNKLSQAFQYQYRLSRLKKLDRDERLLFFEWDRIKRKLKGRF